MLQLGPRQFPRQDVQREPLELRHADEATHAPGDGRELLVLRRRPPRAPRRRRIVQRRRFFVMMMMMMMGRRRRRHDRTRRPTGLLPEVEEPVGEGALRRGSLRLVDLEQARHKVLRRLGNVVPLRRRKLEPPRRHATEDFTVVVTKKWRVAAQEDVRDHAHAPEVALHRVLSSQHFRRDVVRGSDACVHDVGVEDGCELGEAKVDDFDGGVVGFGEEQEVLGLEVAMDDGGAEGMAVIDGLQDLLEDLGGVPLGEGLFRRLGLLDDALEELAARAQLGDDVQELLLVDYVHDLDDVRVVHLGHDLHLARQHRRLRHAGLVDRLHRVVLPILRAETDRPVVALPQNLRLYRVLAPQLTPRRRRRRRRRPRGRLSCLGHHELLQKLHTQR
mmetsp:Transcript_2750/g.9230  ORF Transcript_2750/g.9230 Transcript_2750/m.9230 type:complete len:389 (-) Transcript_2750:16-1182(-)